MSIIEQKNDNGLENIYAIQFHDIQYTMRNATRLLFDNFNKTNICKL